MVGFQNIWTVKNDGGNSDIDEIKNSNGDTSMYKKYFDFSVKEIQKYHQIQNNIIVKPSIIKLDDTFTLLGNKITEIAIEILKLSENKVYEASDINTKEKVTVTNPTYIEGIGTLNTYLKNIEYKQSNKFKKIIEESLIGDNLYYSLFGSKFMLSQLSTFNIKVVEIKNGKGNY